MNNVKSRDFPHGGLIRFNKIYAIIFHLNCLMQTNKKIVFNLLNGTKT